MKSEDFDNCLVAYHPSGEDNRYVFTGKQVAEIKKALDQKSLVDEIRDLVREENASTTSD